jgi:hypothetical protein
MLAIQAEVTTHTDSPDSLAGDSAALATEAYRLLELLRSNDLSDEDLERLSAVARELDRRGVAFERDW